MINLIHFYSNEKHVIVNQNSIWNSGICWLKIPFNTYTFASILTTEKKQLKVDFCCTIFSRFLLAWHVGCTTWNLGRREIFYILMYANLLHRGIRLLLLLIAIVGAVVVFEDSFSPYTVNSFISGALLLLRTSIRGVVGAGWYEKGRVEREREWMENGY